MHGTPVGTLMFVVIVVSNYSSGCVLAPIEFPRNLSLLSPIIQVSEPSTCTDYFDSSILNKFVFAYHTYIII